jgi:hypothetical protein
MDMNEGQLMSIIALIISSGGILIGVINHKRIRSNCCGRRAEASFDIDNTSPVKSSVPAN